jgi:protocatechuate 4,5-dioxygenase alpha chain
MSSNWRHDMPTVEAYWLDKVLYELHHRPEDLSHYRRDPHDYLARYPLGEAMKRAILDNDVGQLYLSGVNPYLLRAHCIGMGIPEQQSLAALRRLAEKPHG